MARITVEDCTAKIPNKFDIIEVARYRVRALDAGDSPKINSYKRNKNPVIALREIAEGLVDITILDNPLRDIEEKHRVIEEDDHTSDDIEQNLVYSDLDMQMHEIDDTGTVHDDGDLNDEREDFEDPNSSF